jgi:hypothetical protein
MEKALVLVPLVHGLFISQLFILHASLKKEKPLHVAKNSWK